MNFPDIPIHRGEEQEEIKFHEIYFYSVELGEYHHAKKSIEIKDIEHFGDIGSAKAEIELAD